MANTYTQTGTYSSYSISASGDIVELQFASGASDIGLVLGGTFSGTIQFEVGLANLTTGVTWTALTCNPVPSGSGVTSSTAAGTWSAVVAGFTHFRFRASAFASGRCYATVNATLAADGGGIITSGAAHDTAVFASATSIKGVDPGTSGQVLTSNGASTDPSYQDSTGAAPGSPALSIQGSNAGGTAFVGIPNSSFNASTGDVALGAGLEVDAGASAINLNTDAGGFGVQSNGGIFLSENSSSGIRINAVVDSGTGPIAVTAAGGISITDDSDTGIVITESGAGPVNIVTTALQINGTPGISGTGTTMSNVTVVNGIITAATFT